MRLRTATLVLAAAALAGEAGAQQAYRCTDDQGRVTYQERPCPAAADERKVDTTPANTDYDPSQRDRILRQGEEAQRRLEERNAREEAERQRQREIRERDAEREREQLAREAARESAVVYYGAGGQPILVPPHRPKPLPKPQPRPVPKAPVAPAR